jgi:hypothetical protein
MCAFWSDAVMPSIPLQPTFVVARLLRRLNLRFPGLFLILALLTLVDLLIPDFIPFADEIGLVLLTALLGLWKNRKAATPPDGTG